MSVVDNYVAKCSLEDYLIVFVFNKLQSLADRLNFPHLKNQNIKLLAASVV